jgi:hypothetical protein
MFRCLVCGCSRFDNEGMFRCVLCGAAGGLRTEQCYISEATKAKLWAHADELKPYGVALEEHPTLGKSIDTPTSIGLALAVADSLDSGVLRKLVVFLWKLAIPKEEILRLRLADPEEVSAVLMPGASCNVEWRNNEPFCQMHAVRLLDRPTYEAKYGKLDQPSVGMVLICPVSKSMLSKTTAAHDAIEEYGIKLPE